MGKLIAQLEADLKKLNLGVEGWVPMDGHDSADGTSWCSRSVGYAKVDGKWRIAVRTSSGCYSYPPDDANDDKPFNEAPRDLRVAAIGKIPDLLEKLSAAAEATTKKIKDKLGRFKRSSPRFQPHCRASRGSAMSIVVSDTSPIFYLAEVSQLNLLPILYGTVIIPRAVHEELRKQPRFHVDLQRLIWIEISTAQNRKRVEEFLKDLDLGEAEAVALSIELGADLRLVDESLPGESLRSLDSSEQGCSGCC